MPFQRPTLPELIERAAVDIEAQLPGVDARLRRSNLGVLARVHAGAVDGLYGYLEWIADQLLPDTAETEHLDRWAAIWNVARVAAAPGVGSVTFTGVDGTAIAAGTVLARADGVEYSTDAIATIASGVATAAITASVPGSTGTATAGTQLRLASPVPGIDAAAVVSTGGLVQGAEAESDASLRDRLLDRIGQPPQGGSSADYVAWAREVPGVTRVWVTPGELGLGTVTVRFVRDDDAGSIIPDAGEVALVQATLDDRRPVTAAVTVVAPVAVALNMTIALTPNSAPVRSAVEASVRDAIARDAAPGATILVSHLREAIALAAGETDHVLSAPSANVTHAVGQMAVMGTITWA
jgi:uncharacterized phage protein gp47/JayE